MVHCCEHGNEGLGSIKKSKFLDQLGMAMLHKISYMYDNDYNTTYLHLCT